MEVPPEIAFRNIEPTDSLKNAIQEGIENLEKVYDRLTSCRVMVEQESSNGNGGRFRVRIDMTVPGSELVVNRRPAQKSDRPDAHQLIDAAFDTARRRLKEYARQQRGDVKAHGLPPHGRVIKIFDDGYGFIEAADGREIYFHENAVQGSTFDELEVGLEVRYTEEMGDEGPQATAVVPLDEDEVVRDREVPLPPSG